MRIKMINPPIAPRMLIVKANAIPMTANPPRSQFIGSCNGGAFRIVSGRTMGVGVGSTTTPAAAVGVGGSGVGVKSGNPGRGGRFRRALLYQI